MLMNLPTTCARQTTKEYFPAEPPSHYYKLSLSISLIVLSGLKRLDGNQKCIFEVFKIIPCIITSSLKSNSINPWKDQNIFEIL